MRRSTADRIGLSVALGAVLAFLAWRVLAHGILPIAPDDAAYIGVGRRLLALHAPTGIDGTLFTIRSWVWPVIQGSASRLVPGDPFRGPQLMGVTLGALTLVGAVVFAYRRSGGTGAVAVALVMMVTPVIWDVAASPRVDVALLAFLMVTLTVAAEPSPRRVLIAGALAGLTMLVKETSAPLVLLPLAWWGAVPAAEWRRWTVRFMVAFSLVVGWWFVTVLVVRGEVFPLEGFSQAAGRSVPRAWNLDGAAIALIVAWVVGAAVVFVRARASVGVRVLLVAVAAMVPATAVAWFDEFALRQFAPIALLGAIVLGLALAGVGRAVWTWVSREPGSNSFGRRASGRRSFAVAAGVLLVVGFIVPIVRVGTHVQEYSVRPLDRDLASWLELNTAGSQTIASTFRFKAQTWARVDDRITFNGLLFDNPVRDVAVAPMVWVDWSEGSFHVLRRQELTEATRHASAFVISGRHRLGPAALATWLTKFGGEVGASPAADFGRRRDPVWMRVYTLAHFDAGSVPTIVTTAALQRMSDARVAGMRGIVLAGDSAALTQARQRLRSVGAAVPDSLVAFPK